MQLGPDAALDPVSLAQLVAKGKGRYRLTPGMELVATINGVSSPLESARQLVRELRACAQVSD